MTVVAPRATTKQTAAALSISGLWKCYPNKGSFATVLSGVDLAIQEGEFVTIVGPSGCGKSTMLAILAGLDTPTAGQVSVLGQAVDKFIPGSAFVFQRDLLLEWRTVLDNVLLPYQLRGESVHPHRERARQLLSQVGLDGAEGRFPWQLSGGMRQRVAICRALIGDPDVLFMDEPFGALDALTRERLNDDLLQLCSLDRKKTVAFVTHDVAEAVYLGDRVIVMGAKPGRIFADIRVDLPHPRTPEVRETLEFATLNALVRSTLRDEEEAPSRTERGEVMTITPTRSPRAPEKPARLTEQEALVIAQRQHGHGVVWRAFRSDWVLYPVSLTLAVASWYLLIWAFSLPEYLLPAPHSVAIAARDNAAHLLGESWTTLTEIVLAFLACVVIGIPVGLLIASSQVIEKLINPLLVLSQGIPKIALAPVFLAWFGFGLQANLAIGFLIAVFPIVVNTVLGMHALDPAMIRLGRSTGASRFRLFMVVRLPTALPSIFAGMKISVTFAAVGAIIGEFAAGTAGLGYLIQVTVGNLAMPLGFAAIVTTALVGLVTYISVELLERLVLRSHPKLHRR